MKVYKKLFDKVTSPENLFLAWYEFKRGKGSKPDVLQFEENLEQNIFALHRDLLNKTYKHGLYTDFYIYDPKLRHIYKAIVRDRVLHHAVFQILNPVFEPAFIPTSFSCRLSKGTHKGILALEEMLRKVSHNYTCLCYALKCDVLKFFDTVDHCILLSILKRRIKDSETMSLLREIIESYEIGKRDRRERERVQRCAPVYL